MDPVRNPFAPGAGTPPPELAGRSDVIEAASVALRRVASGRPAQSVILVGLRGVGKTVLLNRIKQIADSDSYFTLFIEAHEGKTLPELLIPGLRSLIIRLSATAKAKDLGRRAMRVLKSFANSLSVTVNDVEIGLSIDAEHGVADSGDLESDLPELMLAVASAAKTAGVPIAIMIDELQYLSEAEFSALIMSIHKINQNQSPLILVGAGLPQILSLAGNSKSYSERLFRYPTVGALEREDAIAAIANPAEAEGVSFTSRALERILDVTERYPYFLQQWAYEAWNVSTSETIDDKVIELATEAAIQELDQSFFKVRFDRCTPSEKKYMRALAELGAGRQKSGNIADIIGVKSTSVAPTRSALIRKGMIYSPSHGITEFTVPLFDQYMRRVMKLTS